MRMARQCDRPGCMPSSAYREVERTYAVDATIPLPVLTLIAGVSAVAPPVHLQLSATYFDTPALDLSGHRITLRRRTGGEDDGWHVKLPVSVQERTELHRPPAERPGMCHPRCWHRSECTCGIDRWCRWPPSPHTGWCTGYWTPRQACSLRCAMTLSPRKPWVIPPSAPDGGSGRSSWSTAIPPCSMTCRRCCSPAAPQCRVARRSWSAHWVPGCRCGRRCAR